MATTTLAASNNTNSTNLKGVCLWPAHLLSVVEQALQPDHASLWIIPLALHKSEDKET